MTKENVAVIEIVDGPEGMKGRRLDYKGIPFIIGRAPQVDLTIPDNRTSKNHALIEQRGHSFYLVDLESLNGTLLNGERVNRPEGVKLQHGDDITIASTKLKFYLFTNLEEKDLRTIQKRITLNAIRKYSNKSAVLYTEILRFKELYTRYETIPVDALRDKFSEAFRELVYAGGPYYAAPKGERAIAFFDSTNNAIEFAKEMLRFVQKLNLELLRNPNFPIKKLDICVGIDAGSLSIQLGDEGRIEHISGAPMIRARLIIQEARSGELLVSDNVFSGIPEKLRASWGRAKQKNNTQLGPLHKYQSDTTARF